MTNDKSGVWEIGEKSGANAMVDENLVNDYLLASLPVSHHLDRGPLEVVGVPSVHSAPSRLASAGKFSTDMRASYSTAQPRIGRINQCGAADKERASMATGHRSDTQFARDVVDTMCLRVVPGQTVRITAGILEGVTAVVQEHRTGGRVLIRLKHGVFVEVNQFCLDTKKSPKINTNWKT